MENCPIPRDFLIGAQTALASHRNRGNHGEGGEHGQDSPLEAATTVNVFITCFDLCELWKFKSQALVPRTSLESNFLEWNRETSRGIGVE